MENRSVMIAMGTIVFALMLVIMAAVNAAKKTDEELEKDFLKELKKGQGFDYLSIRLINAEIIKRQFSKIVQSNVAILEEFLSLDIRKFSEEKIFDVISALDSTLDDIARIGNKQKELLIHEALVTSCQRLELSVWEDVICVVALELTQERSRFRYINEIKELMIEVVFKPCGFHQKSLSKESFVENCLKYTDGKGIPETRIREVKEELKSFLE